ncbi:hypothetical protein [Rathayibacter sp. SD072]|uniref:hypothetical protein n=1 Tax=Rathayibacter sp. SD072 TaxID=2781731 RepID=UPI001A971574|nr:hypothetical protein [Rathayibacter sp. SD072]MBO0985445.1 hypothetical protein [Rathayibacter sp. SD072]
MVTRRTTTAAMLAVLAMSACTAPSQEGAATPPTATTAPTTGSTTAPTTGSTTAPTTGSTPAPLGPVDLPEGETAAITWTDQVGAPEPQTVRLTGEPLSIRLSVACDTADAEVTVEVEGLMTSSSTCVFDEGTTRGEGGGGGGGTMRIAVDQDARIVVTTDPADAHWSGAVSTGPRAVPAP